MLALQTYLRGFITSTGCQPINLHAYVSPEGHDNHVRDQSPMSEDVNCYETLWS